MLFSIEQANGHIAADYDTNGAGGSQTVIGEKVNDGAYHIIRFIRGPDNAKLYVDKLGAVINTHTCKFSFLIINYPLIK